jgi:hypothetical protein
MASSPRWKCHDKLGTYQASCKDLVIAAGIMLVLGPGATVRDGHTRKTVYTEGVDGDCGESLDAVVSSICNRWKEVG